jgi:hypothetical protein
VPLSGPWLVRILINMQPHSFSEGRQHHPLGFLPQLRSNASSKSLVSEYATHGQLTVMKQPADENSKLHVSRKIGDSITPPNAAAAFKLSRPDELSKTLRELEIEKLALLRRLAQHFPDVTNPARSSSQSTMYLPSVHAHTVPLVSYTPAQENVLLQNARGVIKQHIQLLSQYNEIKDVAQNLIGIIADHRNVTIRECQEDFGVKDSD